MRTPRYQAEHGAPTRIESALRYFVREDTTTGADLKLALGISTDNANTICLRLLRAGLIERVSYGVYRKATRRAA